MGRNFYLTDLKYAALDGLNTACGPMRVANRLENPDAEMGSFEEIANIVVYGAAVLGTPIAVAVGGIEFLINACSASTRASINLARGPNR